MCPLHSFYFYIQLKTSTGDLLRVSRPFWGDLRVTAIFLCKPLCIRAPTGNKAHAACNQAWKGFFEKMQTVVKENRTQGHLESPFAVRTRRGDTSLV